MKKADEYCEVNTEILDDFRLSWTAKGLYIFLQVMSEEVKTMEDILKFNKNTREEIEEALKELIEYNYLKEGAIQ